MGELSSNNKTIAKNTVALYFRMFLVLAVGLYTSRVVLKTLGVEDYGIFNVVGGFVSMLAYINKVFVDATQRFMIFAIGENEAERIKTVFSTSVSIHLVIAFIIILVGDTFGLWFVNNRIVLPAERLVAANWVYQCALLSLVMSIVSVPYRACIIAHEHMRAYAYFSVIEAVLKLLIVYALYLSNYDKLIVYSILHLLVAVALPVWNIAYCRHHFIESKWKPILDVPLLKEMFSYSGWVAVGSLGFSFKDQFSGIIMNRFLGAAVNAAKGIALQVNSIVMSFADSFTTALLPQITKEYADDNIKRSKKLVFTGSKISFYLMSLISIPIILKSDYILHLWLGIVPEYANWFLRITLIAAIYYASSKTLTVALQATGNIKWFQIGVSIIMLSELPVAFFLLKSGYSPVLALAPSIITNIVGVLYRIILLKHQVQGYAVSEYLRDVFLRVHIAIVPSFTICFFICRFFYDNFFSLGLFTISCIIITAVLAYTIGLNRREKNMIGGFLFNTFKKLLRKK